MKKIVIASVVMLVLLAPLISYGAGNYYGVCWPERRILSNDELIAGLISQDYLKFEFVVDDYLIRDAGIEKNEFSSRIVYGDVEQFHKDNPECCIIRAPGRAKHNLLTNKGWSFQDPSFWLRISGFAHANIGVSYNTPIMTKNGRKIDTHKYGSYWTNSCGHSVEPPEKYGAI